MLLQQLTISYECLSSIGNSIELESMMSEIVITFSRKTGAVTGSYYHHRNDAEPLIRIGKTIAFNLSDYNLSTQEYYLFTKDDKQIVVLPLKHGYLKFIYKDKEESIQKLASMFANFKQKINLSIAACNGVKQLEELNDDLEDRVEKSVKQIRENEKMLISQSKQVVMGEMIEMIAHQWRQPITSIGMIANNVLFDMALGEIKETELKISIDKINTQVMHLSKTIDDFRDFFKESKTEQITSFLEILEGTMSIIDKQLQGHNIEIIVLNKSLNTSFYTYKNELIQVFLNILGNAKDAFDDKHLKNKQITIAAVSKGKNLHVTIQDTAGGIETEIMQKVFEPYFSTKMKKNGTGLGLYMSKIIVEEHLHGTLTVTNTTDGAMFEITIPLKERNYE